MIAQTKPSITAAFEEDVKMKQKALVVGGAISITLAALCTYSGQQTNEGGRVAMNTDVSSMSVTVAKEAIEKGRHEKDAPTVSRGLQHSSLQIRIQAAKAFGEIDDPGFVPELLTALRDNQAKLTGGTETEIYQRELNTALIAALEQQTHLNLDAEKGNVEHVIRHVEQWVADRKTQGGNSPPATPSVE